MVDQVELVERVARAVYAAAAQEASVDAPECSIPGWDIDDEDAREFARLIARAAIEAMPHPNNTGEV